MVSPRLGRALVRLAPLGAGAAAALGLGCWSEEHLVGAIPWHGAAPSAADTNPGDAPSDGSMPPFGSPQLIVELSDPAHEELDPALTPDELEIFFRSEPRQHGGSGRSEIVVATRFSKSDPWGTPQLIEELDAPEAWNLSPEISADGLTLWFASDRAVKGDLDLWVTKRSSRTAPWSSPTNASEINSPSWDTDESVDPSQTLLLFARSADLYGASRPSAQDPWSPPAPVPELNSAADDWDAAFARDGLTLVFSSNRSSRPELTGALHLYTSYRRSIAEPFAVPSLIEELTRPGAIDEDAWIANDGKHIVFTSNRAGGRDLYEAWR